MKCCNLLGTLCVTVAGAAAVIGSIALADPPKDGKAPAQAQLPPGMTEADMQACIAAATPGKMHELLGKDAGTWAGKGTMWMAPGADPIKSDSTCTITKMMDGRFTKAEFKGDMPGMGPFEGFAIYGFDNVTQEFVATWLDNFGTGIATGKGKLSSDGSTITWTFSYNCPIQKKLVTFREVDKTTSANSKTCEMYMTDPKTGKEYKSMVIESTRTN